MADKQYIVKTTIRGIEKKGGKIVVIKSGPAPQHVPAGLVKELLERGAIEEVPGATGAAEEGAGGDGEAGD